MSRTALLIAGLAVLVGEALTDMTEEILLDTDGLAPGRSEVVVNQGRSTSFTIG